MCEDLLKRVRAPLEDALAKSGEEIDTVFSPPPPFPDIYTPC
jgi:hypothetical protein